MSAAIIERVFSEGTRKALELGNAEYLRAISIGDAWTTGIVGALISIDASANFTMPTDYGIGIGMTSDRDTGGLKRAIDGGTNNWAGLTLGGAMTYNATSKGFASANFIEFKHWANGVQAFTGAWNASTGLSGGTDFDLMIPAADDVPTKRAICAVIQKPLSGSGALKIYPIAPCNYPPSNVDTDEMTEDDFWAGMEGLLTGNATNKMNVSLSTCIHRSNTTSGGAPNPSTTIDLTTYGNLDTVSIYWKQQTEKLNVHALGFAAWATS